MIAVTGHRGRIGSALCKAYKYEPLKCDLTKREDLFAEIVRIQPEVIINCAGYTDVDGSIHNSKKAYTSNYTALLELARMCIIHQIRLVHLSTSYVFTGRKGEPYFEESDDYVRMDNSTPYAYTKLLAENLIRENAKDFASFEIIRLVSPYGDFRNNDPFKAIYNQFLNGGEVMAADNVFRSFSYIPHIIEGIKEVAEDSKFYGGVIHIASSDTFSYYGFAHAIAFKFGFDKNKIVPYTVTESLKPLNAGLDTTLAQELLVPIYTTEQGLMELKKTL